MTYLLNIIIALLLALVPVEGNEATRAAATAPTPAPNAYDWDVWVVLKNVPGQDSIYGQVYNTGGGTVSLDDEIECDIQNRGTWWRLGCDGAEADALDVAGVTYGWTFLGLDLKSTCHLCTTSAEEQRAWWYCPVDALP